MINKLEIIVVFLVFIYEINKDLLFSWVIALFL